MACPFHHFAPNPFCGICGALGGGFVSGFQNAPFQWTKGLQRMRSQKGVILARKGAPEEDENQLIGKEIRAISGLLTGQNADSARTAWGRLPGEARTQLTRSGFEAIGSLAGGIAASQVFLFGLSYMCGRGVAMSATMRPLLLIRMPAYIAAGAVLTALSSQGSFAMLISRQQRVFTEYPGSEQLFRNFLDEANKDKRDQDKGDKA